MTNVALTYSALGRHEEALVLYEAVLEFRLRVLPEGHPHIGEWHSAWFFFALFDVGLLLSGCCR